MPRSHPQDSRLYQQMDDSPRNDWLERLAQFYSQFGRFLRDGLGVALIAFAVMSFFALWNWTDGFLLTPIATVLRIWFGWGSLFILLGIAYLGYILLQRERTEIKWDRIIGLELASLLTLGLLAGTSAFFHAAGGVRLSVS